MHRPAWQLVMTGLLVVAACNDEEAVAPLPAPGGVANTLEVQVVDATGTPVEGAEIYYLGDIDWRKPTEEQLAALKEHGSDQEELVKHLGSRIPATGSTCFLPVPKDWGVATARKGSLYGELNLAPGAIGRTILEVTPAEQLWLELVDPAGSALDNRPVQLEIRLASNKSVIYPLGKTNELGRIDLSSMHKKLRRFRSDGEQVDGLSLFVVENGEERLVKMFDPEALPQGLVKVEHRQ